MTNARCAVPADAGTPADLDGGGRPSSLELQAGAVLEDGGIPTFDETRRPEPFWFEGLGQQVVDDRQIGGGEWPAVFLDVEAGLGGHRPDRLSDNAFSRRCKRVYSRLGKAGCPKITQHWNRLRPYHAGAVLGSAGRQNLLDADGMDPLLSNSGQRLRRCERMNRHADMRKLVGISSGRIMSLNARQMLSLCSIDVRHGDLGEEVVVLWGDPGTRQKEIRAIVSRFPYLDKDRNEHVDVGRIPHSATKR